MTHLKNRNKGTILRLPSKFIILFSFFLCFPNGVLGGSYATFSDGSSCGNPGPPVETGFSSMEEAGLWGWENSWCVNSGKHKYGGIVPYYWSGVGDTYWWGYFHNHNNLGVFSGPHKYYRIVYDTNAPAKPSLLKQPREGCSAQTPIPKLGNPILIANGNKFQTETDYQSKNPFGLNFIRYYNSTAYSVTTEIGIKWRHNFARRVAVSGTNILIYRDNGQAFTFNYDGINWVGDVIFQMPWLSF